MGCQKQPREKTVVTTCSAPGTCVRSIHFRFLKKAERDLVILISLFYFGWYSTGRILRIDLEGGCEYHCELCVSV